MQQVVGVCGVGLVALVNEPQFLDEGVVRLLAIVHDGRPRFDVGLERSVDPLGRRLAVLAHDGQDVLVGVDRHDDAYEVLRKASLGLAPEVVQEVGVVEVHLVDPDPARQHHLLLPGIYRREHLVPPQMGGRMAHSAGQLDEAKRGVVTHHFDYPDDLVKRKLGAREYRPGERAEPGSARWATPPRSSLRSGAVFEGLPASAGRARRNVLPNLQQLVDSVGAVLLPAPPGADSVFQFAYLAF